MKNKDVCPFCGSLDTESYEKTHVQHIRWSDGMWSPGSISFTEKRNKCTKCRADWSNPNKKER